MAAKIIEHFSNTDSNLRIFASKELFNYINENYDLRNKCNILQLPKGLITSILFEIIILPVYAVLERRWTFVLDATTFYPLRLHWVIHQDILPFFPEYYDAATVRNKLRNRLILLLQRWTLWRAKTVFFQTEFARNRVSEFINLSRSVTIPHGITQSRTALKRKALFHDKGVQLVSVSPIYPYKDLRTVLRALSSLNKQGIVASLNIVGGIGDEKEYNRLLTLIDELKISPKVSFAGQIDNVRVKEIISDSDVVIFSSLCETFGIILLEALREARPIIAPKVGYADEILKGVFPSYYPSDSDGLVYAVKDLLGSFSDYDESVFEALLLDYDWRNIMAKYEKEIIGYVH